MEKPIIALTFDDGREMSHVINGILKKNNIPATFYITTGMLQGRVQMEKAIPMTMEAAKALAKDPLFEIAAHGDSHLNTEKDIRSGIELLRSWGLLKKQNTVGFASPGTQLTPEDIRNKEGYYKDMGLSYIRLSCRIITRNLYRSICRKVARITGSKKLYIEAYRETIMKEPDGMILYSVPVLGDASADQIIALVDTAISEKAALILMFHSISKPEERCRLFPWIWSYDKFQRLCSHLEKERRDGELQIITAEELYRALRQE